MVVKKRSPCYRVRVSIKGKMHEASFKEHEEATKQILEWRRQENEITLLSEIVRNAFGVAILPCGKKNDRMQSMVQVDDIS